MSFVIILRVEVACEPFLVELHDAEAGVPVPAEDCNGLFAMESDYERSFSKPTPASMPMGANAPRSG